MSLKASLLIATLVFSTQYAYAGKRRKATDFGREAQKKSLKRKKEKRKNQCFNAAEAFRHQYRIEEALSHLGISLKQKLTEEQNSLVDSEVFQEIFNLKTDEIGHLLFDLAELGYEASKQTQTKLDQAVYLAVDNSTIHDFSIILKGASRFYNGNIEDFVKEIMAQKAESFIAEASFLSLHSTTRSLKNINIDMTNSFIQGLTKRLIYFIESSSQDNILPNVFSSLNYLVLDHAENKGEALNSVLLAIVDHLEINSEEELNMMSMIARKYFHMVDKKFVEYLLTAKDFDQHLIANDHIARNIAIAMHGTRSSYEVTDAQKEIFKSKFRADENPSDKLIESYNIALNLMGASSEQEGGVGKLASLLEEPITNKNRSLILSEITSGSEEEVDYAVQKFWGDERKDKVYARALAKIVKKDFSKSLRVNNLVGKGLLVSRYGTLNPEAANRFFLRLNDFKDVVTPEQMRTVVEILKKMPSTSTNVHKLDNLENLSPYLEVINNDTLSYILSDLKGDGLLPEKKTLEKIAAEIERRAPELQGQEISKFVFSISSFDKELGTKLAKTLHPYLIDDLQEIELSYIVPYLQAIKDKCPECVESVWNRVNWGEANIDHEDIKVIHSLYLTKSYMQNVYGIELSNKGLPNIVRKDKNYFENHSDFKISNFQKNVESFIRNEISSAVLREHFDQDLLGHIDIFIPEHHLVVEVDGPTHYFMNKAGEYIPRPMEQMKEDLLKAKGLKVIHVPFHEWNNKFKGQLRTLLKELN
ncbi:RAP domain-containing protein [Halobacteriovorax sp. GB3]|uniref:RAP domain-containing protein n=1 Tax=Halobacteriovorax sp. GB3 TaxID=2719615 RepID=UPI00235FDDC0|nr:RAP domain-containing protein [Halobacteriovorax sp. GB3]MDD0851813.1 RAP domain-containing protein [Halobacteriovorax sp. GB3]